MAMTSLFPNGDIDDAYTDGSTYIEGTQSDAPSVDGRTSDLTALLEQSEQAVADQLEQELAQIDEQLAARDALYADLIQKLEWQVTMYERELERLSTPFATKSEEREWLRTRLRDLQQAIRDERREHWRDRQQLERERRAVRRELAEVDMDLVSELLDGD